MSYLEYPTLGPDNPLQLHMIQALPASTQTALAAITRTATMQAGNYQVLGSHSKASKRLAHQRAEAAWQAMYILYSTPLIRQSGKAKMRVALMSGRGNDYYELEMNHVVLEGYGWAEVALSVFLTLLDTLASRKDLLILGILFLLCLNGGNLMDVMDLGRPMSSKSSMM